MFHFEQIEIDAGSHVFVVNSAWYEMSFGWDIRKPRFRHPGWPSIRYEDSDFSSARGEWVSGDRFQFASYSDGWGWSRYITCPHWFAILLLLSVPTMQLAHWQLRGRIKQPPAFPVTKA